MAVGVTVLVAAEGLAALVRFEYRRPGPLMHAATVAVPHGGALSVGEALAAAGVIDRLLLFRAAAAVTAWQGPLRAAEFSFAAGASLDQVLTTLRTGQPVQHLLTIPEGVTGARVAILLVQAEGLQGVVRVPAEGRVLPQTYAYERGMSRDDVLLRAGAALEKRLATAWAGRDPTVALVSPRQALVLASMVERETSKDDERPLVARVFYNRIRLGMRLQSDPTALYGVSGGFGFLERKLSRADLDVASPYNTYGSIGLPAGPICNPGEASIEAVLHPAGSEALYFVADGTGGHAFSENLEEHERNVVRYRSQKQ